MGEGIENGGWTIEVKLLSLVFAYVLSLYPLCPELLSSYILHFKTLLCMELFQIAALNLKTLPFSPSDRPLLQKPSCFLSHILERVEMTIPPFLSTSRNPSFFYLRRHCCLRLCFPFRLRRYQRCCCCCCFFFLFVLPIFRLTYCLTRNSLDVFTESCVFPSPSLNMLLAYHLK